MFLKGEEAFSYGYGGTAKISVQCKFSDYGEKFEAGDVIASYLVRKFILFLSCRFKKSLEKKHIFKY